ncbi:MAG: TIGR03435 family protein [Acidobacteriota bacterium]|nr:TIGR03435 family protein [Acidobacteriota bacterium]
MKAVVASLVLALPVVCAQSAPSPVFEVASIRKHDGPLHSIGAYSASGLRLTLGAYNFRLLIMEAFHLRNDQVYFPAGVDAYDQDFYDIAAEAPGPPLPTTEALQHMLQSLLADRFALKTHRETRELAVYALVVDKHGPLLKASTGEDRCSAHIGPLRPGDRAYRYQLENCTLEPLTNVLQSDRPVIDKTGLTGRYDITIFATPPYKMRDSSVPGDIALEDAIRQLGLKLEARKEPVEVLVVDRIEKPTAN